jgi:N-acetylglutamate synthase-like GNAT family acetyltransferase
MTIAKPMPDAFVRTATLDDTEAITALINSSFRKAEEFFISEDRIDCAGVRSFVASGAFLLAEQEGTIVGCVYVEQRPDARAYLGLLAIDPTRQQSGLGSLLMDAAEDHCRGWGALFMDINVVNIRKELPGFYQKRGYVETGTTSQFPDHVKTKIPCHFIEMSKPL